MGLKANTIASQQLSLVLERLSQIRSIDFSCYKRSTLGRRIEQRMRLRRCATVSQYCDLMEREAAEADALAAALLIKLTGFFRDSQLWERMRQSVLPKLVEGAAKDGEFRVWSVGCASGQETYSIAMLLADTNMRTPFPFKVFGTDRDEGAVAAASRGRFSSEQVRGVPAELLQSGFRRDGDDYLIRPELRRSIVFGVQDVVNDPPIARIDLVLCRNLFVYLDAAGQRRALLNLYQGLKPGCLMVLGKSEILPLGEELFLPVDAALRIFRKGASEPQSRFSRIAPLRRMANTPAPSATSETYLAALNAIDVAAVGVSKDGIVTLWNLGAARLYGKTADEVLGRPVKQLKLPGAAGRRLLEHLSRPAGADDAEEVLIAEDINQHDNWQHDNRQHDTRQRGIRLKMRSFSTVAGGTGGAICLAWEASDLKQAPETAHAVEQRGHDLNIKSDEAVSQLGASNTKLHTGVEELKMANERLRDSDQSLNEELPLMNAERQLIDGKVEAAEESSAARSNGAPYVKMVRIKPQSAATEGRAIAVVGFDANGRVSFCNRAATQLLGFPEERMLRRSIQRLSMAAFPKAIEKRIKDGVRRKLAFKTDPFDGEIQAGKIRLSCRLTPLTDGGSKQGTLLIIEPARRVGRELSRR